MRLFLIHWAALAALLAAPASALEADTVTPACVYLSDADAAAAIGSATASHGSSGEMVLDPGNYNCGYFEGDSGPHRLTIAVFTQAYIDARDADPDINVDFGTIRKFFDSYVKGFGNGKTEKLSGIGEAAYLWTPPSNMRPQSNGLWGSNTLGVFKNNIFIMISFSHASGWQLDRDAHIALAKVVAAKM